MGSGASFCKTSDSRFIIKFIEKNELKMFLNCAPRYFNYMSRTLFQQFPTILCKILGVHSITWKSTSKKVGEKCIIVMPNLFYNRSKALTKTFDIKGSWRNRKVNLPVVKNSEIDSNNKGKQSYITKKKNVMKGDSEVTSNSSPGI